MTLPTLVTPYAHVPFARRVLTPAWGQRVSHDMPFADGISGRIPLTITAETPLLVGGFRRKATKEAAGNILPFQLETRESSRYAIPPSTLQGMIRSIIETVAFGRMGRFVDDKRFGIRDLSGGAKKIYVNRLNDVMPVKNGIVDVRPKVRAGWLRGHDFQEEQPGLKVPRQIEFKPCDLARIEYTELAKVFAEVEWDTDGDAAVRYGRLPTEANLASTLHVDQDPKPRRHGPRKPKNIDIFYRKAFFSSEPKTVQKRGNIVITGMTPAKKDRDGNVTGQKHLEFFFYGDHEARIFDVNNRAHAPFFDMYREFHAIHEPNDGRKMNPTWAMMTGRQGRGMYPCAPWFDLNAKPASFYAGGWMPIFYISKTDENGKELPFEMESFGLAYMFKLAHRQTARELLRNVSQEHLPDGEHHLDLASLIFGIEASEGVGAKREDGLAHAGEGKGLKRRAWFDFALGPKAKPRSNVATRLGELTADNVLLLSPKPQFFPIYVRQPSGKGRLEGQDFATYTPLTPDLNDKQLSPAELARPEPAGMKVWPAIQPEDCCSPSHPKRQEKNVSSKLTAFNGKDPFNGEVHIHNLRPIELGALLWALTLGDPARRETRRHRLGMAKAFGWGQIDLKLGAPSLHWCAPEAKPENAPVLDVPALIAAFETYMDRWCIRQGADGLKQRWRDSAQVRGVLEAAKPRAAKVAVGFNGAFPPDAVRVIGYPGEEGYKAYKNLKDGMRVQPPLGEEGWEFSRR